MGVWIEMRLSEENKTMAIVTPCVGVWIEITQYGITKI